MFCSRFGDGAPPTPVVASAGMPSDSAKDLRLGILTVVPNELKVSKICFLRLGRCFSYVNTKSYAYYILSLFLIDPVDTLAVWSRIDGENHCVIFPHSSHGCVVGMTCTSLKNKGLRGSHR